MISADDDALIRDALHYAVGADGGHLLSESVRLTIRATALTRTEAERAALEREARARAPDLGAVGLGVLRVLLALA